MKKTNLFFLLLLWSSTTVLTMDIQPPSDSDSDSESDTDTQTQAQAKDAAKTLNKIRIYVENSGYKKKLRPRPNTPATPPDATE